MLFTVIFLGLLALETSADNLQYLPISCQVIDIKVGQDRNALHGVVKFPLMSENYVSTNCNTVVNIQTTPNSHLFVRFSKLRVSCSRHAFVIIKGNSSDSKPYCGWYTNWPAVYSSADYLSINYYHGDSKPLEDETIEFSFSSYYNGQCNGGRKDNSRSHDSSDDEDDDEQTDDEFQCRNNRCIDRSAACNGYDSCGDWSDESSATCGFTTGAIVAIAMTCSVLGLLIIICIAAACSRMQKRKNKRRPTRSSAILPAQVTSETELGPPKTFAMNAPPPYTYTNQTDGFAAPYGVELGFDNTEPPKYDEISQAYVHNR